MDISNLTDQEYLDYLYQQYRDVGWEQKMSQLSERSDVEGSLERFSKVFGHRDGLDELTRAYLRETGNQNLNPAAVMKGNLSDSLRLVALSLLDEKQRSQVEHVPVAILPTRRLNGFAIQTPRKGKLVVLDFGIIVHLSLLAMIFRYYYAACLSAESSGGIAPGTFGFMFRCLAQFCVTGDLEQLDEIDFQGLSAYGSHHTYLIMELFVILHEYGHIILGHLDDSNVRKTIIGNENEIRDFGRSSSAKSTIVEYSRSQLDEFEADLFAFNKLRIGLRELETSATEVLSPIGLVLNLFHFCEVLSKSFYGVLPGSDTHPAARDRWDRLLKAAERDLPNPSNPGQLNLMFNSMWRSRVLRIT